MLKATEQVRSLYYCMRRQKDLLRTPALTALCLIKQTEKTLLGCSPCANPYCVRSVCILHSWNRSQSTEAQKTCSMKNNRMLTLEMQAHCDPKDPCQGPLGWLQKRQKGSKRSLVVFRKDSFRTDSKRDITIDILYIKWSNLVLLQKGYATLGIVFNTGIVFRLLSPVRVDLWLFISANNVE